MRICANNGGLTRNIMEYSLQTHWAYRMFLSFQGCHIEQIQLYF